MCLHLWISTGWDFWKNRSYVLSKNFCKKDPWQIMAGLTDCSNWPKHLLWDKNLLQLSTGDGFAISLLSLTAGYIDVEVFELMPKVKKYLSYAGSIKEFFATSRALLSAYTCFAAHSYRWCSKVFSLTPMPQWGIELTMDQVHLFEGP